MGFVFFWFCVDCKHPKTAEELLRVTPTKVSVYFSLSFS